MLAIKQNSARRLTLSKDFENIYIINKIYINYNRQIHVHEINYTVNNQFKRSVPTNQQWYLRYKRLERYKHVKYIVLTLSKKFTQRTQQ